jgi:hypothetical protein
VIVEVASSDGMQTYQTLSLNPASDFNSEYVSGPLEFKIRRISILLGLAITEKIILTRFEADSNIPSRLGSD